MESQNIHEYRKTKRNQNIIHSIDKSNIVFLQIHINLQSSEISDRENKLMLTTKETSFEHNINKEKQTKKKKSRHGTT